MRALVFSDSHGDVRGMEKAINTVNGVDAIIHLGDIERDVRWLEKNYGQYPLYAVLGNNDFYGGRPAEAVIELEGARIFLCHGHTRGVRRGHEGLISGAKARGCSAALYGHTHVPEDTVEDGILIFNPGSCSRPMSGQPTFGILEIEGGKCGSVVVDWII